MSQFSIFFVPVKGDERIAAADRCARGELKVVGVEWTFPSNRVDWLFDASAKKGPYNPEWTWQLNRMSFWIDLARAYRRTGDEKYARAFAQQLSDWLAFHGEGGLCVRDLRPGVWPEAPEVAAPFRQIPARRRGISFLRDCAACSPGSLSA